MLPMRLQPPTKLSKLAAPENQIIGVGMMESNPRTLFEFTAGFVVSKDQGTAGHRLDLEVFIL